MDRLMAEYEKMPENPPITPAVCNKIFSDVVGPESNGRVKGYGIGVTPADIPGLVIQRRGVGAELQQLRLANQLLVAEATRQVELQKLEMEHNRNVMEQYRVELERIAMVNTQEILNIQRQQSHMDFNLNGRLTTALDSYLRGSIGTSTGNTPSLAPPLPPVQTGTNSFHLPQMTGVITPFSRAGLASPQQLAQQHVRNDMGAEDDAVGDAGASRSGVGRSQHN